MTRSVAAKIIIGISNFITWLFFAFFLTAVILVIAEPDIILGNIFSDRPLTLLERLARHWQKLLLTGIVVSLLVTAWSAGIARALLRKINIGGNWIIPFLILLHIGIVVFVIVNNKITFPTPGDDMNLISVSLLSAAGLIYVPFLVGLNEELKYPATTAFMVTTCVALYVPAYFCLLVWVHYISSGDIDLIYVVKRFFGS